MNFTGRSTRSLSLHPVGGIFLSALVAYGLAIGSGAWAADKPTGRAHAEVKHPNGRTPYEVVYSHGAGTIAEPVGIYGVHDGGSKLLLPGAVLGAGRGFHGVLGQFHLGQHTQRYEALAVVDGKLILFSTKTRADRPETFLVVGSAQAPLSDVMIHRTVELDPIQSLKDVNVSLSTTSDGDEVAFISVRQEHPLGSGFTFALALSRSARFGSKMEPVGGALRLLDYEFQSAADLEGLFLSGTHVLSKNLLQGLLRESPDDLWIQQLWKLETAASLKRKGVLKSLKGPVANPKSPLHAKVTGLIDLGKNVPLVDVTRGTYAAQAPYSVHIDRVSDIEISQVYDPVSHRREVVLEMKGNKLTIPGAVDFNPKSGEFSVFEFSQGGHSAPGGLLSVERELYAAMVLGNRTERMSVVKLSGLKGAHRDISFIHEIVGTTHYFVVSRKTSETQATEAFIIEELGTTAQLSRALSLNARFIDEQELRLRVRKGKDHTDRETVAFDNLTTGKNAKEYSKRAEQTRPLLDLNATKDIKEPSQVYFKVLEEKILIPPRDLVYRQYDRRGAAVDHSGLYLSSGDRVLDFFPGALLKKAQRKRKGAVEASPFLDRLEIPSQDGDGGLVVAVSALDTAPEKHQKNFSLHVYVGQQTSVRYPLLPVARLEGISYNFAQLVGAKILPEKKKHRGRFSVLLFFRAALEGEQTMLQRGGVMAVPFFVTQQNVGKELRLQINPGVQGWIENSEVDLGTIKHRIVPDRDGGLYWVANPDMSSGSGNYIVRSVQAPYVPIYPNRGDTRLYLRHGEALEDDWKSLADSGSRWIIYSEVDLEARYAWLRKEEKEKKDDKKEEAAAASIMEKGDKKNSKPLFPELLPTLNRIATPSSTPERKVLLVQAEFKERFLQAMMRKMTENKSGHWSLSSQKFDLYLYEGKPSRTEIQEEMAALHEKGTDKRRLLFVDADELLASDAGTEPRGQAEKTAPNLDSHEQAAVEDKSEDENQDSEERLKNASKCLLLTTDGRFNSVAQYAKDKTFKPRTSMLILATPEEWREIVDSHPAEEEAGVFNSFEVNSDFLTSNWTLWSPESSQASRRVKASVSTPVSEDERGFLKDLDALLADIADPAKSPKQRILIVPEELRELVHRLVMGIWANDAEDGRSPWSFKNSRLMVHHLERPKASEEVNQQYLFNNFDAIRGTPKNKRSVFIGMLEDVHGWGRPVSAGAGANEGEVQSVYTIRDPAAKNKGALLAEISEENREIEGAKIPHLLWYIANEGRRIQPTAFEQESATGPRLHSSTLLIGSKKDLDILQQDVSFENKFGLMDRFEVIQLNAPTESVKFQRVEALFNRPEIAALGYQFVMDGLSASQAKEQLVHFFVHRTEQIASSLANPVESTTAFIRAYGQFRRALVEDAELRKTRKIDRAWISRLFARVFPIPIDLNNLSPNDPYRKIQDPDEAAIALLQAGYDGPLELKHRAVSTVLLQTRGADDARPIPSSMVLLGGTSTGKTFLWRKLFELLGLKEYDFDRPDEIDASGFVLRLADLVETEDPAHPEYLSVDKALQHLSNFLSLPEGYRGFILFDDMHKARSTPVLQKVMTFIQSLFEAKGGYMRVRRMTSRQTVDIPVRNLNLAMTVNPTMDRQLLDRFVGEDVQPIKQLIAALTRKDYTLEESIFARWSDIINLDAFPVDAKAPSLVRKVRDAARQDYSSSARLSLVGSEAFEQIVRRFPNANAREFLSRATNSLLGLRQGSGSRAATLVVPRDNPMYGPLPKAANGEDEPEFVRGNEIETYIRSNMVVKSIMPDDAPSQLELLSLSMKSFRIQLHEAFLRETQRDRRISGNSDRRKYVLVPLLLGVTSSLNDNPSIPLSELEIRPRDLGLDSNADPQRMWEIVQQRSADGRGAPIFPAGVFKKVSSTLLTNLQDFLSNRRTPPAARTRADVMRETAEQIRRDLLPLVAAYYRLKSADDVVDSASWIARLTKDEPKEAFAQMGSRLIDLYLEFVSRLHDPDLQEMGSAGGRVKQMSEYDKVRLFLACVDRGTADLPWAKLTHFLTRTLDLGVRDLSLGQRPEFLHFLFQSGWSPVRTVTRDYIFQTAKSSRSYNDLGEEVRVRLREGYEENCSELLLSDGSSNGKGGDGQ